MGQNRHNESPRVIVASDEGDGDGGSRVVIRVHKHHRWPKSPTKRDETLSYAKSPKKPNQSQNKIKIDIPPSPPPYKYHPSVSSFTLSKRPHLKLEYNKRNFNLKKALKQRIKDAFLPILKWKKKSENNNSHDQCSIDHRNTSNVRDKIKLYEGSSKSNQNYEAPFININNTSNYQSKRDVFANKQRSYYPRPPPPPPRRKYAFQINEKPTMNTNGVTYSRTRERDNITEGNKLSNTQKDYSKCYQVTDTTIISKPMKGVSEESSYDIPLRSYANSDKGAKEISSTEPIENRKCHMNRNQRQGKIHELSSKFERKKASTVKQEPAKVPCKNKSDHFSKANKIDRNTVPPKMMNKMKFPEEMSLNRTRNEMLQDPETSRCELKNVSKDSGLMSNDSCRELEYSSVERADTTIGNNQSKEKEPNRRQEVSQSNSIAKSSLSKSVLSDIASCKVQLTSTAVTTNNPSFNGNEKKRRGSSFAKILRECAKHLTTGISQSRQDNSKDSFLNAIKAGGFHLKSVTNRKTSEGEKTGNTSNKKFNVESKCLVY